MASAKEATLKLQSDNFEYVFTDTENGHNRGRQDPVYVVNNNCGGCSDCDNCRDAIWRSRNGLKILLSKSTVTINESAASSTLIHKSVGTFGTRSRRVSKPALCQTFIVIGTIFEQFANCR